ncbi:hypothetical protein [uncultured Algimonas sp.]|uniref:hypothetical protein n=1 Tax=uncultured Algimonas sp. TaxID=1547920 RepID=UPI0026340845|nr:hypothetical protein [uncultured Algimonas sp.]
MSPEAVSDRWLSLRCWLLRTVLPSAGMLLATLALLRWIGPNRVTLDHTSVMVGFAALYFILVRGGHMLMLRSLHAELMKKHADAYRSKLAGFSEGRLRRGNLGFILARLKRDILVEARSAKDRRARDLFPD